MSRWELRRPAHVDLGTRRLPAAGPRRRFLGALALAALLALPIAQARSCSKGKPCGDSCINVHYTCHVGTGSSGGSTISGPIGGGLSATTAPPALAAGSGLPNASLTPGDVLTSDVRRICTPGYTRTVRDVPQSLKKAVYREYGILRHAPYSYEVDHLISLELGGSNSIRNLWPESYAGRRLNARVKDRLENHLHALVCDGRLDLGTAQRAIATDWVAAYRRYLGPLPTP